MPGPIRKDSNAVGKPVPLSILDTRPLHCSCKATTDVSTFSSLHRGEGMVPEVHGATTPEDYIQRPASALFCRQVATNTTQRRLLAVGPPGPHLLRQEGPT